MRPLALIKSIALAGLLMMALILGVSACSYYRDIPTPKPIDHYVIEHVTVIDVVNQTLLPDRQVEVKAGKIIGLDPASPQADGVKPGIHTIDGRGKYLMPGLWDMHTVLTRLSPELDYPLFIAYGVTSIRSNLTCPNESQVSLYPCFTHKQQWNESVERGQFIGPTIRGSGTFPVNGTAHRHPDTPLWHGTGTVEEARQLVDHYASMPATQRPFFIKNYNWVEPGPYHALVKAARERGLEVGGHMPRKVGLEAAVKAGQRSFAHARLFMFDCSTRAAELRGGQHWDLPLADLYQLLMDTHDPALCAQRYQLLAQQGVYLSPTLLTRRNDYLGLSNELEARPGSQYGHYLFAAEWQEDITGLSQNPMADAPVFKAFYHAAAKTIVNAHSAGVKVMVGTDANDNFVLPGIALHEEILALNRAGMSAFDVLTAATLTPAKYFRQAENLGSITLGKSADLLLLNANPLEDINHTQAIHMVFKGSIHYNREVIEALKNRAKKRAKSHWPTLKLLFWWAQNPGGF